jgi:hypothetical protein
MESITESALTSQTILLTKRNKVSSLTWLRAIGLDAPDLDGRCLHPDC